MSNNISILGLGWLGEPLANELSKQGYSVKGCTTSLEKLQRLSKHSFPVCRIQLHTDHIVGDWDAFMHQTDLLIINFPPKRIEGIEQIYQQQVEQIIAHTSPSIKVIFVSSTSVYGNTNSSVSESSEAPPEKTSGKAVLLAEEALRQHFGNRVTCLRFAGLIGPNRHPGKFLSGKKQLQNPEGPVNLIHQSDCIRLISRIIEKDAFGEVINGCSDKHPLRKEYYQNAAKELGLPSPEFANSTAQSFKIIDNTKSKELLDFTYEFNDPELIFSIEKMPPIQIVGAGPGSPNLLTVAAFNAIQHADVILHDNLVSEDILSISLSAERIYVGRKYGDQSNQKDRQDRINELMHEHHLKGKHVVRLKSGDPYVYGRAAEEARYLSDQQLPFQVIPGISAALAAANIQNIPITERRKSSAVLICTAHTADYSFEQLKGIAELLKAGNTLALYMGLKSLDKIVPKLMEVCQDPSIPFNAISNVSRDNEVILTSTLGSIQEDLKKQPIPMPVVFIIGVEPIQSL